MFLALLVSLQLPVPAYAGGPADSLRTMRFSAGEVFLIPEIGAAVVKNGKDLKVQFVLPVETRKDPYKTVDLKTDDLILLAGGKRVRNTGDLRSAYEAAAIGAEFKLGVQRGQEMMIVWFPKADPKDLPQRQMRIVTADDDRTAVLPAVGVVLVEKGKHVVIDKLLPDEKSAVRGLDVREGDIILDMNGTKVASVKAFTSVYDALEVGVQVKWKTDRAGKPDAVSFVKPKPLGRVIIRRNPQ
jgi:S1-C subfamily serine protease